MNMWRIVLGITASLMLSRAPVWAQEVEVTAGQPISGETVGEGEVAEVVNEVMRGEVVRIVDEISSVYTLGQELVRQDLEVLLTSGTRAGEVVEIEYRRLLTEGERKIASGDKLIINMSYQDGQAPLFYVVDLVRTDSLAVLFGIFLVLVLVVAGRKGVQSLVGLVLSFVVLFVVVIPAITAGWNPILVSVGAAVLIIFFTFYLAHGFNQTTSWAVIGTLCSITLTGVIAYYFVKAARLTGFAAEEAVFLQYLKDGNLNIQGILMAGILIGALGVLDDITISQAAIVRELRAANAKLKFYQLFVRAMRVGQDHIASLVNTLILVYAGGALPLLLLFSMDQSRDVVTILNYEIVAEEVVRMLVGSIGLVLAVPITTLVASKFGYDKKKGEKIVLKKKGAS